MKKISETWILGVEDGSFPAKMKRSSGFKTLLVAVLMKDLRLRDVKLREITVDGTDATDALLSILPTLAEEPRLAMLGGVSYAGFNFVDPFRLHGEANLPCIILTTEKPNNQQVRSALQHHFPDWKMRWSVYKRLKNFRSIKANPKENPIFMETVDLTPAEAGRVVRSLTRIGRLPEPLRVTRMIARGLTTDSYLDLLNS